MDADSEDRLRVRAYLIWESEGCPEGRDREHWDQARRELGLDANEEGAPGIPAASPAEADDAGIGVDSDPAEAAGRVPAGDAGTAAPGASSGSAKPGGRARAGRGSEASGA